MSEIYLDILDPKRREFFRQLAAFKNDGYLAGGTALALQLKHRRSFDFDIFVSHPLTRQFIHKVVDVFGKEVEPRIHTSDLLLVKLKNNIDVHFVHYWFNRLEDTIATESISMAAVKDIATDKVHTIGQRGQWRDYVDIFYLLMEKRYDVGQLIEYAEEKFKGEFAPHLFLQQLTYFGDITEFSIEFIDQDYSVDEIQHFLIQTAKEYKKKVIESP